MIFEFEIMNSITIYILVVVCRIWCLNLIQKKEKVARGLERIGKMELRGEGRFEILLLLVGASRSANWAVKLTSRKPAASLWVCAPQFTFTLAELTYKSTDYLCKTKPRNDSYI